MGEHVHRWLAVIVFSLAVIAFVGWRSLGSANSARPGVAPATPSSPQLSQLMAYTAPLSDSAGSVRLRRDPIVLPRDPFGAPVLPPSPRTADATGGSTIAPRIEGVQLRVTATMLAGARRAAVINDMLIYVGDAVPGGGKLTSVERDRVVVTDLKGTSHVVVVKEGNN